MNWSLKHEEVQIKLLIFCLFIQIVSLNLSKFCGNIPEHANAADFPECISKILGQYSQGNVSIAFAILANVYTCAFPTEVLRKCMDIKTQVN